MAIVSAVQFKPDLALDIASVKNNVRRLDQVVLPLYDQGSEFVVFPELTCHGYNYLNPEQVWKVASPSDSGTVYNYFQNLASSLEAFIVYGFIESSENILYNSANLIAPDGTRIHTYRKNHLWANDFLWATPGGRPPEIVNTEIGRISVLICNDITMNLDKSNYNSLHAGSVDLVAGLCNWNVPGFPHQNWIKLSEQIRSSLVVSNRWGKEINCGRLLDFGQGGSCVIESDGTVHTGGLEWDNDCVVTTRV